MGVMTLGKTSNDVHYRYKATHIKRVGLDMQIADYNVLKEAADYFNEPVNTYIKKAIRLRLNMDGPIPKQAPTQEVTADVQGDPDRTSLPH